MSTREPPLETPSGKPRARAIGIPFKGEPGPLNAVTDIAGLEVGYRTLIRGEGKLEAGKGPVRTGVTAILPRGKEAADAAVFAAMFSLNGNGELTGSHWIAETGRCEGPITITNTHSVGVAHDAAIKWLARRFPGLGGWSLPVAGETYDGWLNDINGFHVTEEDVFAAFDTAAGGAIEEGSVGGGTGMICYGFKGGSGTASRRLAFAGESWLVGAFVQANFGVREQLTIAGVPVGEALKDWRPEARAGAETGSVIAVIATDAPLIPHQLGRLARRVALGIGRGGAISGHGSGDIFLAFSTANREALEAADHLAAAQFIPDVALNPFFAATIEATDEAVLNALVANETMTGRDGHVVHALPHQDVRALLRRAGRI
ncbi:MAG TPA: P1 family peptidase [Caulobacteraceae bacterium]|nr:P1 family peptidase [Caulobacteraceae bacterium]